MAAVLQGKTDNISWWVSKFNGSVKLHIKQFKQEGGLGYGVYL